MTAACPSPSQSPRPVPPPYNDDLRLDCRVGEVGGELGVILDGVRVVLSLLCVAVAFFWSAFWWMSATWLVQLHACRAHVAEV
jgi:hypothetical protein